MNPDLARLHRYPFERLAELTTGNTPPAHLAPINLALGEPRHAPPMSIRDALRAIEPSLSQYPSTRGLDELRATCARWLTQRFRLHNSAIDPGSMLLPVSGTREALFSIAQTVVDRSADAVVTMPNPFYQIYEGAALLAGAEPVYLDATEATAGLPDLDRVAADTWRRCQLAYICSPANPTGAVASVAWLQRILELAERYDFVIAADECYSEIYLDEDRPPAGLLEAAAALGNDRFERCLVFHSLSKTASLPGLRSGFVAGDAAIIERYALYRTYHGAAMPLHHQRISIAAWRDSGYARANRARYRDKLSTASRSLQPLLPFAHPHGGFYLWARTGGDDQRFARALHAEQNLLVLPGSYLARATAAGNPGDGHIRLSLVGTESECDEAVSRLVRFLQQGKENTL